jgi:hypothetical protein
MAAADATPWQMPNVLPSLGGSRWLIPGAAGVGGAAAVSDIMNPYQEKPAAHRPQLGSYEAILDSLREAEYEKRAGILNLLTGAGKAIKGMAGGLSGAKGLGSLSGAAQGAYNMGNKAYNAVGGALNAIPGAKATGKFLTENPYFRRWGVKPVANAFTGMTAGSLADYGAHEAGIDNTNFTAMGTLGGLGYGLGRAGLRDFGGAKLTKGLGRTQIPFTGGTTMKNVGDAGKKFFNGKLWSGAEMASFPLTSFVSYDDEGKYGFNPFSGRDRVKRIGVNAAMAKGDEMARGFGFNSMSELQKHPLGQAVKGWNTGGLGGAISGAFGAMTPEEKTRLFSGLAGGAGMLGGAGLAAMGHPLLGAGLGAAGAGGLGYGLLSKSPNQSSLINSMSPEQRQGMFNQVPDYAWETMSRPQQISTLQGGLDGGLAHRNEFSGAQGGGLKQ